jgi:hypothetical protein
MEYEKLSKHKYYIVVRTVSGRKKHLARILKNGMYKSPCGRRFDPSKMFAIETEYLEPGLCKRCITCRSKIIRHGYPPERLLRVFKDRDEQEAYWAGRVPFGETPAGKAWLARRQVESVTGRSN